MCFKRLYQKPLQTSANLDWIRKTLFSGRMALLVTTFLMLINIYNSSAVNSPNVEGLTAISGVYKSCDSLCFVNTNL